MIKVKGLNKYYNKGRSNELHVINDTTIELPDTGLICILGESGSGKTTLMNTISGLDDFEKGTIDVDGTQIRKYGDANQERVRNEKFGYIFQNYYLLQDRTVEYNLQLALGLYDISDEEKEERIDYVLKAVDMWRYKKRLVSQLSGGQQQRVAIARALAKSPKVIFSDEPTGNLDEANTMRIMGVLKKISANCLVVVVTHEKSIADFFADRILWISDGRIVDDMEKTSHASYSYIEDTNLYLGEYEKRELSDGNAKFEVYDNGEKPEINIRLICDNGKIYISLDNAKNVELLTSESEKKVLEGTRPVVELTDMDELEYSLDELTCSKKPKLGLREIKDIALSNIRAMGKRQIFLVISLLAMSIMMVLAVQDIMTIIAVHEEDVVSTDSHYLELVMEKGSLITAADFNEAKKDLIAALEENKEMYDRVVLNPEVSLSYTYSGFEQLENVETSIIDFSFVPLERLDEDELLYGEMPKSDREIVVDKWVLEKYIGSSNELSNVISNIKHFVGKTVTAVNGTELVISGISESEEMSIYIKADVISTLSQKITTAVSYSTFKEIYQPDYAGDELGKYDTEKYAVLVSESEYMQSYGQYKKSAHARVYDYEKALRRYDERAGWLEDAKKSGDSGWIEYAEKDMEDAQSRLEKAKQEMLEHYNAATYEECAAIREDYTGYSFNKTAKTGVIYRAVGFYSDELAEKMGAEMVMADEAYDRILADLISNAGKCYVYAEDGEESEIKDYIQSMPEASGKGVTVLLTNPHDEALTVYKAEKAKQFNGRIIVTVTIFLVSMVILYFMMKANAVQRMQDLGVYRLIGISKKSILGLFAFENMVITSYTSLIGAILSTFVTYLISSIPSLDMRINYPWYAFLLTVLFLYAVNIIVGILPIRKILRLPPAQLAAKYDI